ncbi:amino acid adenylation domain-containing protein [Nonomuraea sp. NPDC050556]|uniref:amino acid adenylation domain-containing protein n=1 Tax=Nonomuraea sp. NPDC050556 TaxID=3364369 RepID=UPI003795E40A
MVTPSIRDLVSSNARRYPDRPAVVAADASFTYAQLGRVVEGLAARLAAVPPGEPVGVLVPSGGVQLAAVLGVLRAGRAYVCPDMSQPAARIAAQLTRCGVRMVVGSESLPADPAFWAAADRDTSAAYVADEAAYILFTSGSDGAPKPVAVSDAGVANYAAAIAALVEPDRDSGRPLAYATVTSLSTDLGNSAIFPALAAGDTVHRIGTDVVRDPYAFADYCAAHDIDVLKLTPSLLDALLDADDPAVLPRRVLIVGGETFRWSLVDRLPTAATCRVINHYGPTETTIGCLTFDVSTARPEHRALDSVPIGWPLPGVKVRVDDGELLIGGTGVAIGYLGAPELTLAKFVDDPELGRAYLSGDLVRQHPDGVIEFRERRDRQVKIRGYRVEPAEVEQALREHPDVRSAAVVAIAGPNASLRAYIVARSPDCGPAVLAHLRATLPTYLIPASVAVVDEIPQTSSGKRDVRALIDGG